MTTARMRGSASTRPRPSSPQWTWQSEENLWWRVCGVRWVVELAAHSWIEGRSGVTRASLRLHMARRGHCWAFDLGECC